MDRKEILQFIDDLADELKCINVLETKVKAYHHLLWAYREIASAYCPAGLKERMVFLEDALRTLLKTGDIPDEMKPHDYDE